MTPTLAEKPSTDLRSHFVNLTPGKLSGLRQITDTGNRFKVLAIDQSNSFKKALRAMHEKAGKPAEPSYEEIRDVKLEMVQVLSPFSSAVLLDVNYAARQALNSGALPKSVGLIVRVEASKDAGIPSEYEPGWGVEQIKKMGGAAVKLLVYLDTEDKANVTAQIQFVEKVAKACRENDILLMTEELSFPRKGEDKSSPSYKARKVKNITEATRLIGPHTDILKLEFPGDIRADSPNQLQENIGRLNEAAMRPWVLLSAGEKFDLFSKQVEMAMKGGASGYMAGRAIFNEYFDQNDAAARNKFLRTTGSERMQALNKIVEASALSWTGRYNIKDQDLGQAVKCDWYMPAGTKACSIKTSEIKGDY